MNLVGWIIVLLVLTALLGGFVAYYSFWSGFGEGYRAGYEARTFDEKEFGEG